MDLIIAALWLYACYLHVGYFRNPETVNRQNIQFMAGLIALGTGVYGAIILYGVLRGLA